MATPDGATKRRRPQKPSVQHFKRGQIELDDGWTVITRKNPAKSPISASSPRIASEEGTDEETLKRQSDELFDRLTRFRLVLRQSDYFTQLKSRLNALRRADEDRLRIDSVVCVGLGSLSPTRQSFAAGDLVGRVLWQLALLLEVSGFLHTAAGQAAEAGVPIYVQDPAFTRLDVEFLTLRLGFRILHSSDEEAKDYIGKQTMLYAPFLTWHVLLLSILRPSGPQPALYIGCSVESMYETIMSGIGVPLRSTGNGEGRPLSQDELGRAKHSASSFLGAMDGTELDVEFEGHGNAFRGLFLMSRQRRRGSGGEPG